MGFPFWRISSHSDLIALNNALDMHYIWEILHSYIVKAYFGQFDFPHLRFSGPLWPKYYWAWAVLLFLCHFFHKNIVKAQCGLIFSFSFEGPLFKKVDSKITST